jgi:hypothetical protein
LHALAGDAGAFIFFKTSLHITKNKLCNSIRR